MKFNKNLFEVDNVDYEIFNDVVEYFEANEKKNTKAKNKSKPKTKKERQTKAMRLDAIKTVLKKEAKKHGRKSAEYTIIKELQEKDMNEIAIYVGMALIRSKLKPKWTVDEILNVLNRKSFVDKELVPLLANNYLADKDLSTPELKKLGMKIMDNIVKNERETINNIRNLMVTKNKGKDAIFAHEFNKQRLNNIRNAILLGLKTLKESTEDFNLSDFLNYVISEEGEMTYQFMNKLLGLNLKSKTRSLPNEISVVLKSLNELKESEEIKDKTELKKLNKWIYDLDRVLKVLEKAKTRIIIWPESNKNITDGKSLKKYFDQLELEREKAYKVIGQYKKRKKRAEGKEEEVEEKTEWGDERVNKVVNELVKELLSKREYKLQSPEEITRESNKLATELLNKMPQMKKYIRQDHPDDVGEISSRISTRMQSNKALMGRPKKVV